MPAENLLDTGIQAAIDAAQNPYGPRFGRVSTPFRAGSRASLRPVNSVGTLGLDGWHDSVAARRYRLKW